MWAKQDKLFRRGTGKRADLSVSRRESVTIPVERAMEKAESSKMTSLTDSMTSSRSETCRDLAATTYAKEPETYNVQAVGKKTSDLPAVNGLAQFDPYDIVLGRLLGRGNFCKVHEIRAILRSAKVDRIIDHDHVLDQFVEHSGGYRFAVKKIVPCTAEDEKILVADLHKESQYLQALSHPNIIRLRGIATQQYANTSDFFLVLDRLYDTLRQRVTKWRHAQQRGGALHQGLTGQATRQRANRLLIAHDLADAIRYMHEKKTIHRDIKPDNIAFDAHDDIKIFDFGLARVLDSNERQADGTYKMTKMTGSLRFMASEVLKGDRYNEKADVYSFTLVLWEMLALEQPYKRVFRKSQTDQAQQHMKRVCCDGQRPPLKHFWSAAIREIFKHGWAGSVHERYGIEKIQNMLRTEILHLRNGDMSGISDLVCISA